MKPKSKGREAAENLVTKNPNGLALGNNMGKIRPTSEFVRVFSARTLASERAASFSLIVRGLTGATTLSGSPAVHG